MKIFKDLISGDEMFADKYKYKLVDDIIYEVYGKIVPCGDTKINIEGLDDDSDEENYHPYLIHNVDVVINHRLSAFYAISDKKALAVFLKDYMKRVVKKLEKNNPSQVALFQNKANIFIKDVVDRYNELQFYTGESVNYNAMLIICEFREIDGVNTPVFMFFKHGLVEEKL